MSLITLTERHLRVFHAIELGYVRSPAIAEFLGEPRERIIRALKNMVKNRIIESRLGESLKIKGLIKIYSIREDYSP